MKCLERDIQKMILNHSAPKDNAAQFTSRGLGAFCIGQVGTQYRLCPVRVLLIVIGLDGALRQAVGKGEEEDRAKRLPIWAILTSSSPANVVLLSPESVVGVRMSMALSLGE
jgi:hypothetical protein